MLPLLPDPENDDATAEPPLIVGLCLDVSRSMRGDAIAALNAGLRDLFKQIRTDPITQACAEVGIVAFAGRAALVRKCKRVADNEEPRELEVCLGRGSDGNARLPGGTNLAGGLKATLELMTQHRAKRAAVGNVRKDWLLVVLTDGQPPNDDMAHVKEALARAESKQGLSVYPFGIGPEADLQVLDALSQKHRARRLEETGTGDLFVWLGRSIKLISIDRRPTLPPGGGVD